MRHAYKLYGVCFFFFLLPISNRECRLEHGYSFTKQILLSPTDWNQNLLLLKEKRYQSDYCLGSELKDKYLKMSILFSLFLSSHNDAHKFVVQTTWQNMVSSMSQSILYIALWSVLVLFSTIMLDEGWDSGVQKMVNLLLIDTNHTENFIFKCKVLFAWVHLVSIMN